MEQCWFNFGPLSATLAQQYTNIVSMRRVCWDTGSRTWGDFETEKTTSSHRAFLLHCAGGEWAGGNDEHVVF